MEMGCAAEERKVFLNGILQKKYVAFLQLKAAADNSCQVEQKGNHFAVVVAALQTQVGCPHVLQQVFDVYFCLVARTAVVAGDVT